ncbi:MAG: hypothetical protein D6785_05800, partial [Planctomycetota bacterium]
EGLGGEKDIDKAIEWFQKAAEKGDQEAQKGLERLLNKSKEPKREKEEGEGALLNGKQKFLFGEQNKGEDFSSKSYQQYLKGMELYRKGKKEKAFEIWEKALKEREGDLKYPLMLFGLALFYLCGEGVTEVNEGRGRELLEKAINYEGIEKVIRKASKFKDELAWTMAGYMLTEGIGRPPQFKEGAKWYEKAANKGIPFAMVHLAQLYLSGKGVVKNEEKGIALLEKAAHQSCSMACYLLGSYYAEKEENIHSLEKALEYYQKGSSLGDPDCTKAYKNLQDKLERMNQG